MKKMVMGLAALAVMSASAGVLNDISFNEAAGTILDGVADGRGGVGTFSSNAVVNAFGVTDGAALNWSGMTTANTAAWASLGETMVAGQANTILRSTVRIADFNFDAETAPNRGIGFGIGDGSRMAWVYLKVGGIGERLQLKVNTPYGEDVMTPLGASVDETLNCAGMGWNGLQFRLNVDLEQDQFSVEYLREGVDADWKQGNGGTFGLSAAGQTDFMELNRIRIGTWIEPFDASSTISIDQWTIETIVEEPAPEVVDLDTWSFSGAEDGGSLKDAGAKSSINGDVLTISDMAFITNELARLTPVGVDNEAVFSSKTGASYAGISNGLIQVSWDVVAADFSNTYAADAMFAGQGGFGIRDTAAGNRDNRALLRFKNHKFQMALMSGSGTGYSDVARNTTHLENLHIRLVYDLDRTGEPGSFQVFTTLGDAAEVEHKAGTLALHAGFTVEQLRMQFQATNGDTNWQLGDYMDIDNLQIARLNPVTGELKPLAAFSQWLETYSVGSATNLTDDADGDLIDNLTEYAWGGNPADADQNGNVPVMQMTDENGSPYFVYVYYEREDAAERGLVFGEVESVTSLTSASWSAADVEVVGRGQGPAGFEAVTNRVPATSISQFLRHSIEFRQ